MSGPSVGCSLTAGGRVAARTTAPHTTPPAADTARAASARVAPVVRTSSTMTHALPSKEPLRNIRTVMEPRTRRARSPRPKPFCPFPGPGAFFNASVMRRPGNMSRRRRRPSKRWTGLNPRRRKAALLLGTGTRQMPAPSPTAERMALPSAGASTEASRPWPRCLKESRAWASSSR